jgi:hypothetical protein
VTGTELIHHPSHAGGVGARLLRGSERAKPGWRFRPSPRGPVRFNMGVRDERGVETSGYGSVSASAEGERLRICGRERIAPLHQEQDVEAHPDHEQRDDATCSLT